MLADDLEIAVLSFNRGPWLANCLASARHHLPGVRITVYDDASTDPETCALLAALPEGVTLWQRDRAMAGRHGGLYANMQQALDRAAAPFLLYLQDDTQIVRSPAPGEIAAVIAACRTLGAAFLNTLFLPSWPRASDASRCRAVAGQRLYLQRNSSLRHPKDLSYRDVLLADVAALRARDWRFADSEVANARQARALFGPMPLMSDPFVAFVPEVPIFRGKKRNLAVRLAEARLTPGVKAFRPMSDAAVARLRAHPVAVPPYAMTYLETVDPGTRKGFEPNAVDVFATTRFLNKAETKLRKIFRF